jgi:hypothetical protein
MVIEWATASEIENAGFHIWRSELKDGTYERISGFIVPSQGGPAQGAEYSYNDFSIIPGKIYYYKLEDIDYSGKSKFHGPVISHR